jgi:hypothetical protein
MSEFDPRRQNSKLDAEANLLRVAAGSAQEKIDEPARKLLRSRDAKMQSYAQPTRAFCSVISPRNLPGFRLQISADNYVRDCEH